MDHRAKPTRGHKPSRRDPLASGSENDSRGNRGEGPQRKRIISIVDDVRNRSHQSMVPFSPPNRADNHIDDHGLWYTQQGSPRSSSKGGSSVVGSGIGSTQRTSQDVMLGRTNRGDVSEPYDVEPARLGLGHLKDQYDEILRVCSGIKRDFDKRTEQVKVFSQTSTLGSLWCDYIKDNSSNDFDVKLDKLKYCLGNVLNIRLGAPPPPAEMDALLMRVLAKGNETIGLMNRAKQDRIQFVHLISQVSGAKMDSDPKADVNATVLGELEHARKKKLGIAFGRENTTLDIGGEKGHGEGESKHGSGKEPETESWARTGPSVDGAGDGDTNRTSEWQMNS